MKLTVEQYERGILYWKVKGKLRVRTGSTSPGEPLRWSEWLRNPDGSLVQSPGHSDITVDVKADGPVDQRQPIQVRLERCEDGEIRAVLFESPDFRPSYPLSGIPNRGIFHRLVVAVDALDWPEDVVIRHGDVVVRLIAGEVSGEPPVDIARQEIQDNTIVVTSSVLRTVKHEGRFIEVVAPGDSPEAAEQLCRAVLGYVAVCIGEHAIAPVAFSQGTYTTPQAQIWTATMPPFAGRFFQHATEAQTDAIDQRFSLLVSPGRSFSETQIAHQVALRLYERGVRDRDPLNSFLSFFFGIEALANAYADIHGPIPEKQAKKNRVNELLKLLPQPVAKETRGWLRNELHRTTLAENFKFFVDRHQWEVELLGRFQALKKLRDSTSHGRLPDVGIGQSEQAKALLIRMLKAEFGLPDDQSQDRPGDTPSASAPGDEPPVDGDAVVVDDIAEDSE